MKSSRFSRRSRFGWETEPTGPGEPTVVVSKIDTYGSVGKPNLQAWELLIAILTINGTSNSTVYRVSVRNPILLWVRSMLFHSDGDALG